MQAPACRLGLDGILLLSHVWGRPRRLSHTRKVVTAEQRASAGSEGSNSATQGCGWYATPGIDDSQMVQCSGGTWHCCSIWESASRGPKWCLEDDGKKASHLPALSPRSYLGHWTLSGCMASLFAGDLYDGLPSRTIEVCGTRPSGRKKRKWKWPASKTPPVEGRTSREEAQTMRNEPEQDIKPENPGVVCVVHAPSLARMCRDEDPALDKIWVQNKKRPASVLGPWQKSSRHSARMRGRGRHPSSTPNQAKRSKILSFLLFTPLEALSATSVIQDINPPTRRISNIISNVKIYTRAPSRPGCHFRRLWSSAGITNHLPKQKGKGGELSWCHSASQAAFEGLLNCSEGREHETIMVQLRNCDSDPIAGLHPLHHTVQHFVASKSAGRMAHDFHQSTDPDCINSMAQARGTPRGKGSFAMRQRSSSPCG